MSSRWAIAFLALAVAVLGFADLRAGSVTRALFGVPAASDEGKSALAGEVEGLKAALARIEGLRAALPADSPHLLAAEIYSRYPFAFKDELLVNRGAADHVAPGMPAVFQGIFVGRATKVYPHAAVVQTVFDNRFRIAVRVGAGGVEALLEGGLSPKLTLINKNAKVSPGDIVYTADPSAPYGVPVAEARAAVPSSDDLFLEAPLSFSYDTGALRALDLITDYVPPARS